MIDLLGDNDRESDQKITREMFVRLVVQHERRVRAAIAAVLIDPNDINEVVQDVCLYAWENHEAFRYAAGSQDRQFVGWLNAIASNKVRELLRSKSKQLAFAPDVINHVLDSQLQHLDQYDKRAEALASCLKKLPETQTLLIARRYGDGDSVKQIADSIQQSASNVYKQLTRIRLALMRCIDLTLNAKGP